MTTKCRKCSYLLRGNLHAAPAQVEVHAGIKPR